jgi:hypothetical protein
MRTISKYERSLIKGAAVNHHFRPEVENADRTYKDLTSLGGTDWVDGVEFGESIDQPSGSFTLRLRRDTMARSLAPTMGGSDLNRNNALAYAPLLESGRNVKIWTALTEAGYAVGKNSMINSDSLGAGWTMAANGTGVLGTRTTGFTDPFGGALAVRLQFNQGAGTTVGDQSLIIRTQATAGVAGAKYTISIWLKSNTGSNQSLMLSIGGNGSTAIVVTPTWTRYFLTVTWPNTVNPQFQLGLRGTLTAGGSTADILAFGGQLDQVDGKSSYAACAGTPDQTGWKLSFQGRIDKVNWESDPVIVTGRDLGGWVIDAQIKAERTYATGGATAIETVMAQVLAADPVYGTPALYTPVSPGFFINNTKNAKQPKKSIMEALQQDFALAIGWVCRYRHDASDLLRLTFFDVNRANTTAMDSFGPDEYEDITSIEVDDADVRNYIVGSYYDSGGHKQTRTVQNATSQGKYGVKYMEINLANGDPIDTASEMDAMLTAAVNDLGSPLTTQEMLTWFYWAVQLGDLYTFVLNNVHYDSDQKLAVVGYRHVYERGTAKTTIQCRGTVVGAYKAWFRRGTASTEEPTTDVLPVIDSMQIGFPAGVATVEILGYGNVAVGSWRIALSTSAQPSLATTQAAPVYAGQNIDVLISQAVYTGQRIYVSALAYTGSTGAGAESALFTSSIVRDGTGGKQLPIPHIYATALTDTQITLSIDAKWAPGAPPPLEYRYRVAGAFDDPGVFSAWTSAPALPQSIGTHTRFNKAARIVELQARQGSDDTTIVGTTYQISGQMQGIVFGDGKIDRTVPFSQGDYAAKATDNVGHTLHTNVKDTRNAAVNTLFRKSLDGTADIVDGAGSPLAGGARGFLALNSSNRLQTGATELATLGSASYPVRDVMRGVFGSVFRETWEDGLSLDAWELAAGTNNGTTTDAQSTGKQVLRSSSSAMYYRSKARIPYNRNKLYRIHGRVKLVDGGSLSIPVQYFGVALYDSAGAHLTDVWFAASGALVLIADGWKDFFGYMKGFSGVTEGPAPANNPAVPSAVRTATAFIAPVFALNWPGGATSNGETWLDVIEVDSFDEDASNRTYKALTADAAIASTTKAYSNAVARIIAKGYQRTDLAQDGSTVTFADGGFAGVPLVIVSGGISYEPRAAQWSPSYNAALPQYVQRYAQNVTASSCQIRAKLRQKAATTARAQNFAGTTVVGPGSTGSVVVANAPSNDNSYTVRGRVTVKCDTVAFQPVGSRAVEVILESNDGVTGWIERYRVTKTASRTTAGNTSTNFDLIATVNVTGLDSTDQFRWTMLSDTPSGGDIQTNQSTFTPNSGANNNGQPGVTYSTSSGDSYASMTPDGDDALTVDAIEVNS